jgi:NADPH-dependent 2,4-dienoyl-CoA reductase/sulfur reductase-like enzyme
MDCHTGGAVKLFVLREWKSGVMSTEVSRQFDVLVIGGGPAGMAAAASAGEAGARVGVVDDNASLGGQIWRGEAMNRESDAAAWVDRLRAAGVERLSGTRVFDQPEQNVLRGEGPDGYIDLKYRKLMLATGARERFLPFPGWTLPNVMGAGALQALVKSGLPIRGKRVVVAGSGPLLLAVAAYLRKHGAGVPLICEQASLSSLATFGLSLLRYPSKVTQAFSLRRELSGIRLLTGSAPIAAEGDQVLRAVSILRGDKTEKIACDYLACGFHLVPNTELATLLGCRLRNGFVEVDELQRTSVPDIFCVGEPTGIGGVELSLVEGEIAGLAALGREADAGKLFRTRRRLQRFTRALERTFALRPELKDVTLPETIVCRCEDVTYDRLKVQKSWRAAKLYTRCGMGACQGRVCGPATQFLLNWTPDSVRPPIFPTIVNHLAALPQLQTSPEHNEVMRGPQ